MADSKLFLTYVAFLLSLFYFHGSLLVFCVVIPFIQDARHVDSVWLFHPPTEPSLSSLFSVASLSTLSSSPAFNWHAPFHVYAHLLARKRRTEGGKGRLWEVGIKDGGRGQISGVSVPLGKSHFVQHIARTLHRKSTTTVPARGYIFRPKQSCENMGAESKNGQKEGHPPLTIKVLLIPCDSKIFYRARQAFLHFLTTLLYLCDIFEASILPSRYLSIAKDNQASPSMPLWGADAMFSSYFVVYIIAEDTRTNDNNFNAGAVTW